MVLIGLVGAIAISALLSFLGHITRNWKTVSNPLLFLVLAFWMLVNVVGHITGIWAYRHVDLDVYTTTFIIVAPIVFFTLAVTTLVPTNVLDDQNLDLDMVYFSTCRPVFVLLALHTLTAVIADYLPGVTDAPPPAFMITMTILLVAGAITKSKRVHLLLLCLLLLSQAMPGWLSD